MFIKKLKKKNLKKKKKLSSWDAQWKYTALSFLVSEQRIVAAPLTFPDIFPIPSYVCERHIVGSKLTFYSVNQESCQTSSVYFFLVFQQAWNSWYNVRLHPAVPN